MDNGSFRSGLGDPQGGGLGRLISAPAAGMPGVVSTHSLSLRFSRL